MATAIVTGGAKGIGKTISAYLADDGFDIVMCGMEEPEEAQEIISYIEGKGRCAYYIKADISKMEDARALCDLAIEKTGRVDVLVNNAGITRDNLMLGMSEDDFDKVISVNLRGTWNCCKCVQRTMLKQRCGRIINIASIVGVYGNPGQTNYCASKAGVIGLTKSLAKEIGARGITVNAVAPGFIETEMTEVLSEEVKEKMLGSIALKRAGTPADVAGAVAFLASDRAGYITGEVISVTGGM